MIEQYTIATTPKYNFPQLAVDVTLPKRFTEQSLLTLREQPLDRILFNQPDIQQQYTHYGLPALRLNPKPVQLKPKNEPATIVACDTSTMKIGDTSTGVLIAIRGANVWRQDRAYRYMRLGPFIFHVTEENKRLLYQTLERSYFTESPLQSHQTVSTLQQMSLRIASLLERWLQTMISKTVTNGLVLFDGSLTAGTGDTPIRRMKDILAEARRKNNTVMAFSKMTNLRVNGRLITEIPFAIRPPCLIETEGTASNPPVMLLGDVYVAKLSSGNCAFRVDIDKQKNRQEKIDAAQRLLWNDLISQSYPETLRLSHILCTFTGNEVLAMQHYASRQFGIKLVNRPDMHRLLFGPFGRGESFS